MKASTHLSLTQLLNVVGTICLVVKVMMIGGVPS